MKGLNVQCNSGEECSLFTFTIVFIKCWIEIWDFWIQIMQIENLMSYMICTRTQLKILCTRCEVSI